MDAGFDVLEAPRRVRRASTQARRGLGKRDVDDHHPQGTPGTQRTENLLEPS